MSDQITIKPEMGMYKVLKHLNYKAWWALSEFVDNSLQSYIAKNGKFGETRSNCIVEIKYDPNERYLSIEDNSYGIAEKDHQRAFTAGVPPDDATGLSEFGVGMKSAGIWFSPNWKVTTCSIDSDLEYTFEMKLDDLIAGDGTLSPKVKPSPARKGFTKIELFDLHHGIHGRTLGKIKDHLRSIYRCFIRDERLRLMFNGEELRYEEPVILVAPKAWSSSASNTQENPSVEWKKSIDFKLTNGVAVSGFAAVRETGSTKEAGFSIFRRNRVVLGSHDDKFRPSEVFGQANSFEYQRIFGELHLDGVEVSHTKDNINLGEYEEEFLEKLKDAVNSEPKQLIRQARTYKAKVLDDKAIKAIKEVTSKVTKAYSRQGSDENGDELKPEGINGANELEKLNSLDYSIEEIRSSVTNLAESKLRVALDKNQEILFNAGGIDWSVLVRVEGLEASKLYSLSYRDAESASPNTKNKNVDITINKDHELFLDECAGSKEATTVLILLIVTVSVTEMMLTASGNYFARLIHKGFNEQVCNVYRGMDEE